MTIFTELSYVIAIATTIAFLMRLMKQPLIIGHIITGIIVGPFALDIVKSEETFGTFASLGIVLLLFVIGLGLNPKVIKDVGKVAVITGGAQVIFTTSLGTAIAMTPMIGLDFSEAIFVGLALAFSSTIIILKLVGDKKELSRLYAKILIGMILVQDIIATLALVFVSAGSGDSVSPSAIGGLLLRSVLLSTAIFMIGLRLLPQMHKLIAGSQEFLFLFAIGWGFGVASLFDMIGFSLEVGALIAGVALASLPYAQEVSARLRPLRDFFIVVFFISLGTHLGIDNIASVILPAIVLSLLVLIGNPIIVMTTLGLQGYTKRTSFKAGIAMAQISEFSLVLMILAARHDLISENIVSLVTMVALVTIAVSAYMITYTDKIYSWLEQRTRLFEHRKLQYEQGGQVYDMVLVGYQRGGREFAKLFKNMNKRYIVVDYDPEATDTMERRKIPHIFGDITDPEILNEIEIESTKLVVSAITDFEVNKFLVTGISAANSKAVIIVEAGTAEEAMELYAHGASYVLLPHYIGTEKIGSFIKKNGFSKTEFKKYKDKHINYIENHHVFKTDD